MRLRLRLLLLRRLLRLAPIVRRYDQTIGSTLVREGAVGGLCAAAVCAGRSSGILGQLYGDDDDEEGEDSAGRRRRHHHHHHHHHSALPPPPPGVGGAGGPSAASERDDGRLYSFAVECIYHLSLSQQLCATIARDGAVKAVCLFCAHTRTGDRAAVPADPPPAALKSLVQLSRTQLMAAQTLARVANRPRSRAGLVGHGVLGALAKLCNCARCYADLKLPEAQAKLHREITGNAALALARGKSRTPRYWRCYVGGGGGGAVFVRFMICVVLRADFEC
jgi:hypothetical protein